MKNHEKSSVLLLLLRIAFVFVFRIDLQYSAAQHSAKPLSLSLSLSGQGKLYIPRIINSEDKQKVPPNLLTYPIYHLTYLILPKLPPYLPPDHYLTTTYGRRHHKIS